MMKNQNDNQNLSFHEFSDDKSSPLKKYQDLIIGNRKYSELFFYELLTFLFMNMPSLPGLFLRQKTYKKLFKELGRGSTIGIGVSLKQPNKVSIGKNCVIDDFVHISARGDNSSGINVNDKVFIGRSTELKLRNGQINISPNSSIGSSCRIATTDGIINIGEYVFMAAYCYIGGGNHKSDRTDIPIAHQGFESKGGVNIGDDVWIGANCVIADGVNIGKGSIIGACSLVNKDIPEYSIAFGSPAKVVKSRK
jgi:acetyltransferase-like isoleucine patch superfamily enzyme